MTTYRKIAKLCGKATNGIKGGDNLKRLKIEKEDEGLTWGELDQVLHDIGYRVVPQIAHVSEIMGKLGNGEIDIPPLSVAVKVFAFDYLYESPYPAYAVDYMGSVEDAKRLGIDWETRQKQLLKNERAGWTVEATIHPLA